MGWVRGHIRRDGQYVSVHYRRSNGWGGGKAGEAAALALLLAIPIALAVAVAALFVWLYRLAKNVVPKLTPVVAVVWSKLFVTPFEWVLSARHDLLSDRAVNPNPVALTAKLVVMAGALFVLVVLFIELMRWVDQMLYRA